MIWITMLIAQGSLALTYPLLMIPLSLSSLPQSLSTIVQIFENNYYKNCPKQLSRITMLEAVELPGSVAHLNSSLSNVDAYHLPLTIIIVICMAAVFSNIILQCHENL